MDFFSIDFMTEPAGQFKPFHHTVTALQVENHLVGKEPFIKINARGFPNPLAVKSTVMEVIGP